MQYIMVKVLIPPSLKGQQDREMQQDKCMHQEGKVKLELQIEQENERERWLHNTISKKWEVLRQSSISFRFFISYRLQFLLRGSLC